MIQKKEWVIKTYGVSHLGASVALAGLVFVDKWLTDTESVVPDNDMSFRVPKQEERAAIISHLMSLSTP